jgi:galactokinase/mevalonate kinase-like predicted kinase
MRTLRTCVIVASHERQAEGMRDRLAARAEAGVYPRELDFVVLADPAGGRVGSGGATVLAAVQVRDRLDRGEPVLVIQAGGESRRIPVYEPEGKLFAPLPLPCSTSMPPIVLDLHIGLFLRYPWNDGELLISSGDSGVDFDTGLIPEERGDIYGFAKSGSFELGSHHGVFAFNRNREKVTDYFQKESAEFLRRHAALEGSQSCAIDVGIVGFSRAGVASLLRLADAPLGRGATLLARLRDGRSRIDLYFELFMAFLGGISLRQYLDKVRPRSPLDARTLESLHAAFRDVSLHGHLIRRGRFLHFGTLKEYPSSCAELLAAGALPFYAGEDAELRPSVTESAIQCNSLETQCIPVAGARGIYVECCTGTRVRAAGGNLLVGLTNRRFETPIPPGICLDERRTPRGRCLLVYSIDDTWRRQDDSRDLRYCGIPFDRWLTEHDLSLADVFADGGEGYDLLDARLFVPDPSESFTEAYWRPELAGPGWRERFIRAKRLSIRETAEQLADREERRCAIRRTLLREGIEGRRGWVSISEWDFRRALKGADPVVLSSLVDSSDDDLLRAYRARLLRSLSVKGRQSRGGHPATIEYVDERARPPRISRAVKLDQIVWARSPVRLDIAGGWTDTPPFTLREGGEVVNVAVDLNGQPPLHVFCRPTGDPSIRIHSIDQGVDETITRFAALEDFHNPRSPFSLPKAALCLVGLRSSRGSGDTLRTALTRIGCGLDLSLLSAVPKGSGLGSSSILGAAIMAALQRFFGLTADRDELVRQVLQMEQLLTTGGGWQDQIGGIAGGVKYVTSLAGLKPNPIIYQLDPFLFQEPGSASRFTLYYTGITRLAKNILQEVVDRVNTMEPAYLFTLRSLKQLARGARQAIARRDTPALGRIMNLSWEANKLIHRSTTNDEVEALLGSVSGRYAAMKLLGAGGGGYILFLSDTAEAADALRESLASINDDRARLVGMSANLQGLQVTVS